jgi:hypothetical protein
VMYQRRYLTYDLDVLNAFAGITSILRAGFPGDSSMASQRCFWIWLFYGSHGRFPFGKHRKTAMKEILTFLVGPGPGGKGGLTIDFGKSASIISSCFLD